jgi:RimJ/RimL family protein N-acetyltransferase
MFKCVEVKWDTSHEEYIKEVYRMLKDQENKIFDRTLQDVDVMDYVEYHVQKNKIYVIIDNEGIVCAFFMLEHIKPFKDIILTADLHCAVRKHCWGKKSRELGQYMLDYLKDNLPPLKRLVASVPQHNFGVVKLLKDLGFKHEGTLKSNLVFKNKFGEDKYYDELIYSIVREDI